MAARRLHRPSRSHPVRAEQMDMFPDPVRVEPLTPPGRRTTVRGKYRVDLGRRGGTHMVYDDRHGVYCEEHGKECAAVSALAEWNRA